jgi:tetratricopeptide (TPR) repeat protein
MRHILILSLMMTMIATNSVIAQTQSLDFLKVKAYEHQLDDAMEIIDTAYLKAKLVEVERNFQQNSTEINKVRLGIIYHETALNLTFLSKSSYKGYAKKSFDLLTELFESKTTTKELMPFIASHRASALSLVGGETKKLGLVGQAFTLFEQAVNEYAEISYLPEFLRGSVAENLPFFFFSKRKFAKLDMQSIIDKQNKNPDYASPKIMSFVYWAWANQHQSKKYREQSLGYLEKAISLDPNYVGGRKRAEELKSKILRM